MSTHHGDLDSDLDDVDDMEEHCSRRPTAVSGTCINSTHVRCDVIAFRHRCDSRVIISYGRRMNGTVATSSPSLSFALSDPAMPRHRVIFDSRETWSTRMLGWMACESATSSSRSVALSLNGVMDMANRRRHILLLTTISQAMDKASIQGLSHDARDGRVWATF